MATCPHCQTSLPDDFGLLECPNCHASVFVDMDGNVIHEAKKSESVAEVATQDERTQFIAQDSVPAMAEEPLQEEFQQAVEQGFEEQQNAEASNETEFAQPNRIVEPEKENSQENWQVSSSEEAFAEVTAFGNEDHTYQNDGPLSYVVTISGIDSKDLEDRLKEVLSDKKLVLDMDRLLPTLKNGQLKITDLNPAKAYVLVSKIYDLPITVEWEQHVLSE